MKITTQPESFTEITHGFTDTTDEDEHIRRGTFTAEVKLDNHGSAIEFKDPSGVVVGEAAFEVWEGELRVYTWTERQVGNDPDVHRLFVSQDGD